MEHTLQISMVNLCSSQSRQGWWAPKCLRQDPVLGRTLQPPASNHGSSLDKCGSGSRRTTGNAICIKVRGFMPLETLYLWTHLLGPGHHLLPSSQFTSLLFFFYPISQQQGEISFCRESSCPFLTTHPSTTRSFPT